MRVYLDSSALIKRAVDEAESDAVELSLVSFVDEGAGLFSSALAWIEVSRGLRSRIDHEDPASLADLADAALSGIAECPMSEQVVSLARRIGPPMLRSLDAIHLATATLIDADFVVAYDERLLAAASELGFRTASPS